MRKLVIGLVWSAAFSAACGSSSSPTNAASTGGASSASASTGGGGQGGSGGAPATTPTPECVARAKVICEKYQECAPTIVDLVYTDLAQCESQYAVSCTID